MALESGQQFLQYRLTDKIGEGGMGVVWKAEDSQLGREVALKFLTETFASDAERLARFEREAKLLASLNHANIATIHGLEEAEGHRFLVLELVEGDDLATRLQSGPLPLAEAVTVCRQLTEALDAAHERGILHRDLKPANIKVTPDGGVKVLDFGLAKAWDADPASGDLAESPTITHAMTQTGVILGTAAYMSPEQARGRNTDKRTDIWSFGCILFELLAGRTAFSGETVSDYIAGILKGEPEWSLLPDATPPRLKELIARCLEKDRRRRLRDIGDARIELEKVEAGDAGTAAETAASYPRKLVPLVLVLLLGIALGLAIRGWVGPEAPRETEPPRPRRVSITVPPDQVIAKINLSADGEMLLYIAASSGDDRRRLYSRRLDEFEIREVPDSEGVMWASFSPDSRSVAYFTQNRDGGGGTIKKVSLAGGPVVELLEFQSTPGRASARWSSDGTLYVSMDQGLAIGRLPDGGGEPEEILSLGDDVLWSLFLGEDENILFLGILELGEVGELNFRTEAFDIESKERKLVLADGLGWPLGPGRFMAWRDYTIFVMPFDDDRLEISGPETPLFTGRKVSFSLTGTLAYTLSEDLDDALVRVNRDGEVETLAELEEAQVRSVRVSPDGEEVAFIGLDMERLLTRIWKFDIGRKRLIELPTDESWKFGLDWTPAGDELTWSVGRPGWRDEVHRRGTRPADGSTIVIGPDQQHYSTRMGDESAAGTVILTRGDLEQEWDLWLLPPGEGAEPRPILEAPNVEFLTPAVSPNGRWLAFSSDESGGREIYTMPLSDRSGDPEVRLVSSNGGTDPVWAPDGSELFFRDGAGHLMSARVDVGKNAALPGFGKPEEVFDLRAMELVHEDDRQSYDVLPDGSGFIFARREQSKAVPQIHLVFDWMTELDRLHPLDD